MILILVGTVGNFLTIVTLLRRNLRRLVTIRYLIVVSICDTISLYGWNLNSFYKFNISLQNDNLEEISIVHCRIFSYMTFVSLQLSSWCLTAVSLGKKMRMTIATNFCQTENVSLLMIDYYRRRIASNKVKDISHR